MIWWRETKIFFCLKGQLASTWTTSFYVPAVPHPSSFVSLCIQLSINSSQLVNSPSHHHHHQLVTQVIHRNRAIPNQPLKSLPCTLPISNDKKYYTHTTYIEYIYSPLSSNHLSSEFRPLLIWSVCCSISASKELIWDQECTSGVWMLKSQHRVYSR